MKKKLVSMVLVFTMMLGISFVMPMKDVQAAEQRIVDNSILLDDAEESSGELNVETRGQYLQSGSSSIGRIGTGKIKVSATTAAQQQVSTIKVTVMVEKLVDGSWVRYTTWSASKTNAYAVTTGKELTVPRGYYYRVRSIHNANSDRGTSNTSGLYIG